MPEETSYSRTAIERLGLDPDNLGFVGLRVDLPPEFKSVLNPGWEYKSPKLDYVKGYDVDPHITLIYGLLFSAKDNRYLIDKALKDWYRPGVVLMPEVEAFPGDDGYQMYSAIVLTLGPNTWDLEALQKANDELRKLPHVCPFPVYKPHITIGYVRKEHTLAAVERVKMVQIRPFGTFEELDYGD